MIREASLYMVSLFIHPLLKDHCLVTLISGVYIWVET
jgi:hypothetical protein